MSRQDRASRGLGLAAEEVADEVELPNWLCAEGDAPRGVPPAAQRLPAQGPCGALRGAAPPPAPELLLAVGAAGSGGVHSALSCEFSRVPCVLKGSQWPRSWKTVFGSCTGISDSCRGRKAFSMLSFPPTFSFSVHHTLH